MGNSRRNKLSRSFLIPFRPSYEIEMALMTLIHNLSQDMDGRECTLLILFDFLLVHCIINDNILYN